MVDSSIEAKVPPLFERVLRATPDLWLSEGRERSGYLEYLNVGQAYADLGAVVHFHDELFFDGWSQVTLTSSGRVLSENSASPPNASRVIEHANRIRDKIAKGEVRDVEDGLPIALLSTPRNTNYYHFLFDDLARLGFYEQLDGYQGLRFAVAAPKPWQREILSVAGVERQLLKLGPEVHRLHDVWVAPRGLTRITDFRTRGYDRVVRLKGQLGVSEDHGPTRRLFVSRETARHRRLLNEAEVRQCLAENGFEVVLPETMTFADQVELFNEASVTCGVFGAGLANAVFMQPGTCLLELAPPTDAVPTAHNAIFATMCGLRGLRYGAVTGAIDSFVPESHDFLVPPGWLAALLNHFLPMNG